MRSRLLLDWREAKAERIRDAAERRIEMVTEKRFQNLAVRYQRPSYEMHQSQSLKIWGTY